MSKITANAEPAKEFFIDMITKDISLEDCILDLVDNSIDGARRSTGEGHANAELSGFHVDLQIGGDKFLIRDNCGGIPLELARDYAFRFGRPASRPRQESPHSIGLYGIGMKRAMFKIGNSIRITSTTNESGFLTEIDVAEWAASQRWEFQLEEVAGSSQPGTQIEIQPHDIVAAQFVDPFFANNLAATLARDYFFFLQKGLSVKVNGAQVQTEVPSLLEGSEIKPARLSYQDGPVAVRMIVGLGEAPSDDDGAESEKKRHVHKWGWWVLCNERVVLAADRTRATIWGTDGFPQWHPQYNGFLGFVFFDSANPNDLPWSTTKRALDLSSPLYKRALSRMRHLTRTYVNYTNERKDVPDEIRRSREGSAQRVSLEAVPASESLILPRYSKHKVQMANILYKKPLADVDKVRAAMGDLSLSYREVGVRTFDYYTEREVGEE
jgi:hypothetical protein